MRTIISYSFLAIMLAACSIPSALTLSYSGIFKARIFSNLTHDSTIFHSEDLSLKTRNGKSISGRVLPAESEGLPSGFDIREHPGYLFNTNRTNTENLNNKLLSAQAETDYLYNIKNAAVFTTRKLTSYIACKASKCIAFTVKPTFNDYIFTLHSGNYTKMEFTTLIKEHIDARRV